MRCVRKHGKKHTIIHMDFVRSRWSSQICPRKYSTAIVSLTVPVFTQIKHMILDSCYLLLFSAASDFSSKVPVIRLLLQFTKVNEPSKKVRWLRNTTILKLGGKKKYWCPRYLKMLWQIICDQCDINKLTVYIHIRIYILIWRYIWNLKIDIM